MYRITLAEVGDDLPDMPEVSGTRLISEVIRIECRMLLHAIDERIQHLALLGIIQIIVVCTLGDQLIAA